MNSNYTVLVSSHARRGLVQLPPKVAVAIVEFITGTLRINPLQQSKPLTGDLVGLRSARRGDYRVLIREDESACTVLVVRVAHRADVYRTS
ncbi:MAG: type II toxin-antitoxin system RelE/ParE family toxin [Actinomycetes bacterium]